MSEQSNTTYINYTPVDYMIGYLLGGQPFEKKCALLQAVLPVLDDPLLNRISGLVVKSKEIPSLDFIIGNMGYTGSVPALKDDINIAEFLGYIEIHQDAVQKGELSRSLLEISKGISKLSKDQLLSQISKVLEKVSSVTEQKQLSFKEAYLKRKSAPVGMLTFVKELDEHLRGIAFGTMYSVGGFAGQGKTTLGLSAAYGNSVRCGLNGVYLSFEMPKHLLMSYFLSRHSKHEKFRSIFRPVPKEKIIFATMNPEEQSHILDEVSDDLLNNSEHGKLEILDISDFSNTSFSGILSRLSRLNFPIHYMVVDYAQKFKFLAPHDMEEPANRYVAFFNNLCMDFHGTSFSLMMLSQTNRTWYDIVRKPTRGGVEGAYPLTALAEINALERDSTYVSFVYTSDSLKQRKEILINLPKNRYVTTFESPVTVFFDPEYCVVGDEKGTGGVSAPVDFTQLLVTNTLPGFGG
jgi:replicative DNA helicase